MFLKGVVEQEIKKVFDGGKVLREVKVLEQLTNGRHAMTWFQVWGENGIDTSPGKKVELEVELQSNSFVDKKGIGRTKQKLVAVV